MVAAFPFLKKTRSNAYQRLRGLLYRSGLPVAWPKPFGLTRSQIRIFRSSRGILHVGANSGQERFLYHYLQKPALWIEPDRESFRRLSANIRPLRGQKAIRALCWSRAGVRLPFHQTSNNGLSSSVYPLAKHLHLWPGVKPAGKVVMTSQTLDGLLFAKRRDALPYDTLILDTQGSELQILAGAGKTLKNITTIICEACNFEAYRGGCRDSQVKKFLHQRGWKLLQSLPVWRSGAKTYFELVFRKKSAG
jgi:FkbM family methyltransferase